MSKSIQHGKKTHDGASDAMPPSLKTGTVQATRAAIDAYLAKRGMNRHPWKRRKTI
jgi:hypothetical protein